jgi:SCY1-like protein 2
MAVLGIIKLAHENERFGITREQCARTILPFLISNCVESTLNLTQFEQFIQLTKLLLTKVETEQRSKLQQLGAGQDEQIKVQDFNDIFNQTTVGNTANNVDVMDLFASLDKPKSNTSPLSQVVCFKINMDYYYY